jgi:hypothetical protein
VKPNKVKNRSFNKKKFSDIKWENILKKKNNKNKK